MVHRRSYIHIVYIHIYIFLFIPFLGYTWKIYEEEGRSRESKIFKRISIETDEKKKKKWNCQTNGRWKSFFQL